MRQKVFLIALLLIFYLVKPVQAGAAPMKALIVTGQNNHNWQASSPALEKILKDTGLFVVEKAVSPGKGESMADFVPGFAAYDVVVLDYNGDDWCKQAREAFVNYVKKGGGVVVYHAADNAFPGWKEYNEIIGLGGWGNRDEKSGPYLYWQAGKILRDKTPGRGGYHGAQHAYQVISRNLSHPITQGLPEKWKHAQDELYSLLRGPAENIRVLATAYSAPEYSGTGRHEPVLFTVRYGKGRIFHTVLGHAGAQAPHPAMECVGFIVTFQRGAEWAACGKVTQQAPGDFPVVVKDRPAPTDVRRWKDYNPPNLAKILTAAAQYDFDGDRKPLEELENYIRARLNNPGALPACEGRLVEFLQSDASLAAKQFVCRQLRIIGTVENEQIKQKFFGGSRGAILQKSPPGRRRQEKALPVLINMAQKEETSDMARYALEKIPGAVVDRALIKLLPTTEGKIKLGIIGTLGQRGSPESVVSLAELTANPDTAIAAAAITALGRIGGPRSAAVLGKVLSGSEELRPLIEDAYLQCAEGFLAQNNLKAALKIYKKLQKTGGSPSVRSAASAGIAACTGSGSSAAARPGRFGDVVLRTLEKQGDAAAVYLLAKKAAAAEGGEQKALRSRLWRLKGAEVDRAVLVNLIAQVDPAVQAELLQAVAERRILEAKQTVIGKARYGFPGNRRTALRVLKTLCSPADLPDLLEVLPAVKSEADRMEAENTIAAAAAQIDPVARRADVVLDAFEKEKNIKTRCSLLRILGKIGCSKALPAIRKAFKTEDEELRDAAVRVLAGWPDFTAADDLLRLAKSSRDMVHHVLALQGYIRLVKLDRYAAPESAAARFRSALAIARRAEEKKLVLGALPGFACAETLELARSYLKVKELAAEAQKAVEKIKKSLK